MPLRIGIDAPFQGTGSEGGSEHIVLGLVSGLAKLTDGNEEYVILAPADATDWLSPYLGANQKMVREPRPHRSTRDRLKSLLGPLRRPVGTLGRRLGWLPQQDPYAVRPTPHSSGFAESLNLDLLHLLYPLHFYRSTLPTLLTIHDLQHRHFPEYFYWNDIPWREQLFPEALQQATGVSAISWWTAQDLMQQYPLPPEKLQVIPWASPTQCYRQLPPVSSAEVVTRYQITEPFILYPSVTYGHKNHIRLLEAVAQLRDRDGLRISVICTGWKKLHWPQIEKRQQELQLTDQVRFVGYVSSAEMKTLYAMSRFVVFPSLFEGCGLALLEAFEEGKAVAASRIPPFREYGRDAPVYFDPTRVEAIAEALKALWTDETLRRAAVERSTPIARHYRWETVARSYRALYRSLTGTLLTDEDRKLLQTGRWPTFTERSTETASLPEPQLTS